MKVKIVLSAADVERACRLLVSGLAKGTPSTVTFDIGIRQDDQRGDPYGVLEGATVEVDDSPLPSSYWDHR